MEMYSLLILVLICSAQTVFSEDCLPGTCLPTETCCPTGLPRDYSCCPFENAVCCEDFTHCCPEGTICDSTEGSCSPKPSEQSRVGTVDEQKKRKSLDEVTNGLDEVTYDFCKAGTCPIGKTCCPTVIPGDFSCCPYPNAVCCAIDGFCCPEDNTCDYEKRMCIPNKATSGLEKRQGFIDADLHCNDGSICRSDNTCCSTLSGKFGCCPHPDATCCPDKIHCCPRGQVCDMTSHYCVAKQTLTIDGSALPIDFEGPE